MKRSIIFICLSILVMSATAQGVRSKKTYERFQELMYRIGIDDNVPSSQHTGVFDSEPEMLVQQQLEGYNARDIEKFLEPYHEEVEIYNFPDVLNMKGIDNMRQAYQRLFNDVPDLHCEIVNRIVQGDTVIDQEHVTGLPGGATIDAIAIYKIRDGKIFQVYFVR